MEITLSPHRSVEASSFIKPDTSAPVSVLHAVGEESTCFTLFTLSLRDLVHWPAISSLSLFILVAFSFHICHFSFPPHFPSFDVPCRHCGFRIVGFFFCVETIPLGQVPPCLPAGGLALTCYSKLPCLIFNCPITIGICEKWYLSLSLKKVLDIYYVSLYKDVQLWKIKRYYFSISRFSDFAIYGHMWLQIGVVPPNTDFWFPQIWVQ